MKFSGKYLLSMAMLLLPCVFIKTMEQETYQSKQESDVEYISPMEIEFDHYSNQITTKNDIAQLNAIANEIKKSQWLDTEHKTYLIGKINRKIKTSELTQEEKINLQLLQAISRKNLEKVKELHQRGADLNFIEKTLNDPWRTPLSHAVFHSNFKIVKYLVENGAHINPAVPLSGGNPLHIAMRFNKDEIAKYLIDHGANIKNIDNYGTHALGVAIKNGQAEIAKHLIIAGADIENADGKGTDALLLAEQSGNKDLQKFIREIQLQKIKPIRKGKRD